MVSHYTIFSIITNPILYDNAVIKVRFIGRVYVLWLLFNPWMPKCKRQDIEEKEEEYE
jgi:hypothetical protein